MYFITTKRMLEVCFSAHPNIQYRTDNKKAAPASMEKECYCGRVLLHSACTPEKRCRYRKSKRSFSSRIRSKKWSRR